MVSDGLTPNVRTPISLIYTSWSPSATSSSPIPADSFQAKVQQHESAPPTPTPPSSDILGRATPKTRPRLIAPPLVQKREDTWGTLGPPQVLGVGDGGVEEHLITSCCAMRVCFARSCSALERHSSLGSGALLLSAYYWPPGHEPTAECGMRSGATDSGSRFMVGRGWEGSGDVRAWCVMRKRIRCKHMVDLVWGRFPDS